MQLILFLKNMEYLKYDQWGTNMIITFLQQVGLERYNICVLCDTNIKYSESTLVSNFQMITYKGFFDSSCDWVGVENIIFAGSLSPTIQTLPARFASLMHVYYIRYFNHPFIKLITPQVISLNI